MTFDPIPDPNLSRDEDAAHRLVESSWYLDGLNEAIQDEPSDSVGRAASAATASRRDNFTDRFWKP